MSDFVVCVPTDSVVIGGSGGKVFFSTGAVIPKVIRNVKRVVNMIVVV
jgi:hypothetical protein